MNIYKEGRGMGSSRAKTHATASPRIRTYHIYNGIIECALHIVCVWRERERAGGGVGDLPPDSHLENRCIR